MFHDLSEVRASIARYCEPTGAGSDFIDRHLVEPVEKEGFKLNEQLGEVAGDLRVGLENPE